MTDLSQLFRPKAVTPHISPYSLSQRPQQSNTLPRQSYALPRQSLSRPQNLYSQTQVYSPPNYNEYSSSARTSPATLDFKISRQAKKVITYDSMHQEIYWFQSQNMMECLAKIFIFMGFAIAAWFFNLAAFSTALSMFIFCFFYFGLMHNIFGANTIKNWAFYSLIGTTFVLTHQIFLYIINKIDPKRAAQLYYTRFSLIPALYVTVLIVAAYNSLSIITQHSPRSIIQNILSYPKSLIQLFVLIYRLKFAIFQNYVLMMIVTFLISLVIQIKINDIDQYKTQDNMLVILHPSILISELLTFSFFIILVHFIVKVISNGVSKFAITVLYNLKNSRTKVPVILQLLRINENDTLQMKRIQNKISPLNFLVRLLRLDNVFTKSKDRRLSRQQLQNIYRHSLGWIHTLLSINPLALNTKITYSKFYNNYFDIFKQFSQQQLRRCSSSLFQIHHSIQTLNFMISKPKSLKEDLFYWLRVFKKQVEVWAKAAECCGMLRLANQIMEVLSLAEISRELWVNTSIGSSLRQIRDKTEELKDNKKLNPAIRAKMKEYFNKTKRLIKDDKY